MNLGLSERGRICDQLYGSVPSRRIHCSCFPFKFRAVNLEYLREMLFHHVAIFFQRYFLVMLLLYLEYNMYLVRCWLIIWCTITQSNYGRLHVVRKRTGSIIGFHNNVSFSFYRVSRPRAVTIINTGVRRTKLNTIKFLINCIKCMLNLLS
jgi:hypothetical protein